MFMTTYGSVCSGIESASVAWEPLGMKPLWFSEIEPFPSAVLKHHWPDVVNLGDMYNIKDMLKLGIITTPEILVGGTPCQAFSVAGMRKSLEDDRGQLTIEYVRLFDVLDEQRRKQGKPEAVCVWENVPGVLSSRDNAFGCFLAALVGEEDSLEPSGKKWTNAGVVYGPQRAAAWRILDAQYFGVAQRRRRVFVVASARDGFSPAEVLFEREGVRRDSPPSREEGEKVAGDAGKSIKKWPAKIASTLNAHFGDKWGFEDQHINEGAPLFVPVVCHGSQDPLILEDTAFPIGRNGDGKIVGALAANTGMKQQNYIAQGITIHGTDKTVKVASYTDVAGSLRTKPPRGIENSSTTAVQHGMTVRRLTPKECERLQGFPDDHTKIPWRNKSAEDCPDGPRYKAIGNSKAVPVIKWIGERLLKEMNK
jgi:DNA (cytosine-5)-methyltransferase 1